MINASGIGTYLQNIVPLIISHFPDVNFHLLGKKQELKKIDLTKKNVALTNCQSPIYSISEQIELPRKIPKDTHIYWATHYNIPFVNYPKLLVTIYDLFHLAMPELVGGLHKRLYAKYMFARVFKRANAIFTISNFTKNEFIRLLGNRQGIYPIPLGVEESWFGIQNMEQIYPRPYLLFVGNVKPHKNLTGLIDAFELVANKIPHDLVIVGKKDGFITGDKLITSKANKLGARITFTGHVEDEILKRYFTQADAFIFPSLYEGFGLPPLEAMAAGCPVLVSSRASLPEVCGNAAIYFDPLDPVDIADKILKLLNDSLLKETLIIAGKKRAREFTWEKCATKTSEIISRIL